MFFREIFYYSFYHHVSNSHTLDGWIVHHWTVCGLWFHWNSIFIRNSIQYCSVRKRFSKPEVFPCPFLRFHYFTSSWTYDLLLIRFLTRLLLFPTQSHATSKHRELSGLAVCRLSRGAFASIGTVQEPKAVVYNFHLVELHSVGWGLLCGTSF